MRNSNSLLPQEDFRPDLLPHPHAGVEGGDYQSLDHAIATEVHHAVAAIDKAEGEWSTHKERDAAYRIPTKEVLKKVDGGMYVSDDSVQTARVIVPTAEVQTRDSKLDRVSSFLRSLFDR